MSTTPTPPTTWAPGAIVPGTVYRVIRPLGQGGMGEVYEVEHDLLGTRRALKVLARPYAGRQDLTERLRVEARGLAGLKHPNLVEVYDLGTSADGRIFFAMELLKGATLRELLRNHGKLSPTAAVRVTAQVLDALVAAHGAGMLHRDVKPENVFVCRDGVAKLLDFGVAKAIDASIALTPITAVGMALGTPRYMSPEQAHGDAVDARTDVYSVGLVIWELLVGRPAFEDLDFSALAALKLEQGVAPLGLQGVEGLPPALCAVVDRACQTRPDARHATAAEFAAALRLAMPPRHGVAVQRAGVTGQGETATTVISPLEPGSIVRGETTEIDPASAVGAGQTLPAVAADEGMAELTERIAAVQAVDRDQPTVAGPDSASMLGPSGTQMLPAVAAQHRAVAAQHRVGAGAAAAGAVQREAVSRTPGAATMVAGRSHSAARAVNWKGIAAGVTAFVVPVSAALIVGYARFGSTPEAPALPEAVPVASEPSVEPVASSQDEPDALTEAPGSTEPTTSASAPAVSSSPAGVAKAIPTRPQVPAGPPRSAAPPATTPPKPSSSGRRLPTMPASGL